MKPDRGEKRILPAANDKKFQELERQVEQLSRANATLEAENSRLRGQLARSRSEALLNQILDILPVGVWLTDANGKITQANIAAQMIWSGAKYIGLDQYEQYKAWWYSSRQPLTVEDWAMWRATTRGETSLNEEIEIESFDGKRKIIWSSAIPIFGNGQQVTGVIVVFMDITDRKRAEAALNELNESLEETVRLRTLALEDYARRLERSNRDLEDFAFVASHDLQEPLRKVLVFSERVVDRAREKLDPEERDYLDRMSRAATRMSEMLVDLLSYSRINTRAQPPTLVDLQAVVADVLSDLEIQIERTDASVEVGNLPVIEAEPLQIRRLMQNLINNGLKFHHPDVSPVVKVTSRVVPAEVEGQPEMVELRVEDNGIGFTDEGSQKLFQPFYRLVGRSQYEGSGMGLAICRKIVDRHNGTIEAEGRVGEGSVFVVRLPMKQSSS